jgi:hypothetical protein
VYDNVLLGQGYRTPRGAVIDECGATAGMVISWKKPKNSEKNLLHHEHNLNKQQP